MGLQEIGGSGRRVGGVVELGGAGKSVERDCRTAVDRVGRSGGLEELGGAGRSTEGFVGPLGLRGGGKSLSIQGIGRKSDS